MDFATLGGLILGLSSLLLAFILEGGKAGALYSYTALMIVLGGTIGATAISFSTQDLKRAPGLIAMAFKSRTYDNMELIERLVGFANQARRDSVLSLEESLDELDDNFLKSGLQLIIDGIETSVLQDILENEIFYMEERHQGGIAIFEIAGGYSPTMGIIGTVMGLVHVLGNMSTPEKLAPAIAVAFIATLYGVGLANIFWLPMAAKLRARDQMELLYRRLTVEGLLSIQEKENPNFIKEKLESFLNHQIVAKPAGEQYLGEEE
jgi:chemotaxis protein MotA